MTSVSGSVSLICLSTASPLASGSAKSSSTRSAPSRCCATASLAVPASTRAVAFFLEAVDQRPANQRLVVDDQHRGVWHQFGSVGPLDDEPVQFGELERLRQHLGADRARFGHDLRRAEGRHQDHVRAAAAADGACRAATGHSYPAAEVQDDDVERLRGARDNSKRGSRVAASSTSKPRSPSDSATDQRISGSSSTTSTWTAGIFPTALRIPRPFEPRRLRKAQQSCRLRGSYPVRYQERATQRPWHVLCCNRACRPSPEILVRTPWWY